MPEISHETVVKLAESNEPWWVRYSSAIAQLVLLNPMTFIGVGLVCFMAYGAVTYPPMLIGEMRRGYEVMEGRYAVAADKRDLAFEKLAKGLDANTAAINKNSEATIRLMISSERQHERNDKQHP